MSERHTRELAATVARLLDELPLRDRRRVAAGVGLEDLVEEARDEYLAGLDADDGLAVLTIPADAVVAVAAGRTPNATAAARRRRRRRRR